MSEPRFMLYWPAHNGWRRDFWTSDRIGNQWRLLMFKYMDARGERLHAVYWTKDRSRYAAVGHRGHAAVWDTVTQMIIYTCEDIAYVTWNEDGSHVFKRKSE